MAFIDTRAPCKSLGCRERASALGYCDMHASERVETKERHKYYNEHKRDKQKLEVYNSYRWKKLSKYVRSIHPLCTRCEAMSRYTLATLTDHLRGFTGVDDSNAWDIDCLYPLCNECHAIVTRLERNHDFSIMPLDKAVLLKYQGAKIRIKREVLL